MDPTEALRLLRELTKEILAGNHHYDVVCQHVEQFEALDAWLSKGGFLPEDWAKGR